MRKTLLTIATIVALITGCKKSYEPPVKSNPVASEETVAARPPACPSRVMEALGRELPAADFADVRVKGSTVTIVDGIKVYKIPFFSKDSTTDFILVAVDSLGNYLNGKLINIHATNDWQTEGVFSGEVTVNSLDRSRPVKQIITKGKPNDPNQFHGRSLVLVTFVGGITMNQWFALLDALGMNIGIPNPTFIPTQGGGGGGPTDPVPPSCENVPEVVAVPLEEEIIFDYSSSGPRVDLQRMFNCFDAIPDAGATYTVKLCADLPVNGNPWWMEWNLSPGHAFLTLTKTNGSQSVTQSFGFYPRSGALSLSFGPVPSKIVDDGQHEINASMTMNNVSWLDFNAVKNLALSYSTLRYDLNDRNCADFALDCFNQSRPLGSELVVPNTIRFIANYGTTPNGIYEKLKEMKDNNHPEAANIQIGVFNSPTSHGECP
jgi:hypothetical protein